MSVYCDVLIIGGGATALIAALEAKKTGAEVVIVSKGPIGRSGNTIVAGSGFSAYISTDTLNDREEAFFTDTLTGGQIINDENLVEVLVQQSGQGIRTLESYGVAFAKDKGDYIRRTPPGHSRPRSIPTVYDSSIYQVRGLSITLPLRTAAQQASIRMIENTPVVKLVTHRGVVTGAVGISREKNTVVSIQSKATVLAAGGGGRIYAQTNNTSDVTGDSYALALEAGAILRDMEFVQFYPSMMAKPVKIPVSTPLFGDGAVLRNRLQERFLANYAPEGDMATRDVMARAIFSEVESGRGVEEGGVYLDCRGIPSTAFQGRYQVFREYLRKHGLDPQQDLLVVSPTTHFFMGGIKIDSNCETTVKGLFAAGEAAGGVHGANRLSGNALTETVVFGAIAGKAAAGSANGMLQRTGHNWVPELATGPTTVNLPDVKRELRQAMWSKAGLVRSKNSLESVLQVIANVKDVLASAKAESLTDLAHQLEIRCMATVAEVIALSAMSRRESRGSHYRQDYPERDDNKWLGSIEACLQAGRLKLEFVPKSSG